MQVRPTYPRDHIIKIQLARKLGLERLGLDPERVRTTAAFHEAYAETTLIELQSLLRADESVAGQAQRVAWLDRFPPPSAVDDETFTVAADAATALREAAQWELYLDPVRAARLLARSGELFLRIGHAFGAYLLVAAGRWAEDPPFRFFADAVNELSGYVEGAEVLPRLSVQPQQQVYFLLACGGSRPVRQELGRELREAVAPSLHRSGVAPVGSLGTPIRRLWDVALRLLDVEDVDDGLVAIGGHLAAMGQRYAETVDLARTNEYLWANGAAPVDVGDLDIAGITAMTARRYGAGAVREVVGGFDPTGRVPMEAGLTLAGLDEGQKR